MSSAVVEVNGETLEVSEYGQTVLNGVMDAAFPKAAMIGGFPVALTEVNRKVHSILVELDDGSGIELKSFKDLVSVKLLGARDAWEDATGLLGSARTGEKLGRDGRVIEDANEFGAEVSPGPASPVLSSFVY